MSPQTLTISSVLLGLAAAGTWAALQEPAVQVHEVAGTVSSLEIPGGVYRRDLVCGEFGEIAGNPAQHFTVPVGQRRCPGDMLEGEQDIVDRGAERNHIPSPRVR